MSQESLTKQKIKNISNHHQQNNQNFKFNRYEIYFHLTLIGIHLILAMKLVAGYAISNLQPKIQQSFLTPYIGLMRDGHDSQWQAYRSNLILLISCALLWKALITKFPPISNYIWVYGFGMLVFSFRADLLLYIGILIVWYVYVRLFYKTTYFVVISWAIMLTILFLNEKFDHFSFLSNTISKYIHIDFLKNNNRAIDCSQLLNMTFLKLISYGTDLHRGDQSRQLEKHLQKCLQCHSNEYCQKGRDYYSIQNNSFFKFMNYILFPPTLLTGPPITYKNFNSFMTMPTSINTPFLKWLFLVICFEIYQHLFPVISISEDQSLIEMELFSLFHLTFIWFKFLIIWKTARMWSLMYGIDVVDNMTRCICNNYGFQGFWRMWHRGFNQWLIRYLYVPLGGNRNYLSVVAVVSFVAFWHDHKITIILWAFIIVLFMIPEIIIKRYFRKNYSHIYPKHWFKYASALASALYIYFLCLANLIGFGYGIQKSYILFYKIKQQWISLVWSLFVVSCACILMFYKRDQEKNVKNY